MPFVGGVTVPFVGGIGTELFAGTAMDELGIVDDTGKDDEETPVEIGPATLELAPVPWGAVLAGQKPLSQEVYWTVSLAAQL